MIREPRYTTTEEEKRIRAAVAHAIDDAIEHPDDRFLVSRYTYYLRTIFNSMLRDRMQRAAPRYQLKGTGYDDAEIRSRMVVARQPDAADRPQGPAVPDSGARAAE